MISIFVFSVGFESAAIVRTLLSSIQLTCYLHRIPQERNCWNWLAVGRSIPSSKIHSIPPKPSLEYTRQRNSITTMALHSSHPKIRPIHLSFRMKSGITNTTRTSMQIDILHSKWRNDFYFATCSFQTGSKRLAWRTLVEVCIHVVEDYYFLSFVLFVLQGKRYLCWIENCLYSRRINVCDEFVPTLGSFLGVICILVVPEMLLCNFWII